MSRQRNNANIIAIGARLTKKFIIEVSGIVFKNKFEGGELKKN